MTALGQDETLIVAAEAGPGSRPGLHRASSLVGSRISSKEHRLCAQDQRPKGAQKSGVAAHVLWRLLSLASIGHRRNAGARVLKPQAFWSNLVVPPRSRERSDLTRLGFPV